MAKNKKKKKNFLKMFRKSKKANKHKYDAAISLNDMRIISELEGCPIKPLESLDEGYINLNDKNNNIQVPVSNEFLHLCKILDRDLLRGKLESGEYKIRMFSVELESHDRGDGCPCINMEFRFGICTADKKPEAPDAYYGYAKYKIGDTFTNGSTIKILINDKLMDMINGTLKKKEERNPSGFWYPQMPQSTIALYLYE